MQKLATLLTLSGLLGAFASAAVAQDAPVTLHVGDNAPPLVIAKWIKGAPVAKLNDGKVRVVEFWATWCGPCKVSIPHLTELAKKYKGNATFIGVDSYEHTPKEADYFPKVEKFVADFGAKMDYTVAIDGAKGTMGKTWMEAAGQNGIPTAFVVDQKGKIAWIGHPMNGLDEVVKHVVAGDFDMKAEAEKANKEREEEAAQQKKMQAVMAPLMDAVKKKDYKAAVAAIDKIVADDESKKMQLAGPKFDFMAKYDEAGAQVYAGELAAGMYKGNAMMLNQLAWTMIGDKPFANPDTKLAVKIAEQAVKITPNDPNILDTLALAYFKDHRKAEALATEQKAVTLGATSKDVEPASLADMKKRLAEFKSAQ